MKIKRAKLILVKVLGTTLKVGNEVYINKAISFFV